MHLLIDGELRVPVKPARPRVVLDRAERLTRDHASTWVPHPDPTVPPTLVHWEPCGTVEVVE